MCVGRGEVVVRSVIYNNELEIRGVFTRCTKLVKNLNGNDHDCWHNHVMTKNEDAPSRNNKETFNSNKKLSLLQEVLCHLR